MNNPTYNIHRLSESVSIDNLSNLHFSQALPATLLNTVTAKPASQRGEAKLVHDNISLYAFFDLDEVSPIATLEGHDDSLYEENVVELFIDPLGRGRVYYELQVNPLNTTFDALIINDINEKSNRRGNRFQGFREWNPASFKSRSEISNGKWKVYLKIDFSDLFLSQNVPPKPGDRWRGNILRVDYNGKEQTFDSWSPNFVPDFNNTNRFGNWVFE